MTAKKQSPIKKGYIQVYTGDGKGKTTAALGVALRATGCGLKTYIGQFMKGQHYSELDAVEKLSGQIVIEQYGKKTFTQLKKTPAPVDVRMAKAGLKKAKAAMLSRKYDIVVLDEIIAAHFFNLITLDEMLEFVTDKPDGVELIFTGRYAPTELIDAADLVTEMTEVKHYYKDGVTSRKGIEN
jgi:cob(I)alamin adenosyltransferase